jgi:hypothetical protein
VFMDAEKKMSVSNLVTYVCTLKVIELILSTHSLLDEKKLLIRTSFTFLP